MLSQMEEIPDPEAYEREHDEALLRETEDSVEDTDADSETDPVIELIEDTEEEDPDEEPFVAPEPVTPSPVATDEESVRSGEDRVVSPPPSPQSLSLTSSDDDDPEEDTSSEEERDPTPAPAPAPVMPPPPLDLPPVSGAEHAYVVQFMTRDLLSAEARLNEARRVIVEEREARLRIQAEMRTTVARRTRARLHRIERRSRERVLGLGIRGGGVIQARDVRRVVRRAFARVRALLRRGAAP